MTEPSLEQVFHLPPSKLTFDTQQQEAIDRCCDLTQRVVPVTGKAGVGKTQIIKEIYRTLVDAGYVPAVSAPTGKAAKRIQEATGIPAVTNHRLLGYGMPYEREWADHNGDKHKTMISTGPRFKQDNPLPYDVLLCDEYAMVNREIHAALIHAMKPGAAIRMFGDVNQLKPIEQDIKYKELPSAFETAIAKFNGVVLNTIYRQNEGSGIARNADMILAGKYPKAADDFVIKFTDQPVDFIKDLVIEGLDKDIDFSKPDHQIITPSNKSWVGTKKLNLTIQSLFWNRADKYMELERHDWDKEGKIRVQLGTKVVYTANTYELGENQYAMNGEVGTVIEIDHEFGSIDIDFADRVVRVPPLIVIVKADGVAYEQDPRKNIDLAYVLTTHKMQGSECKHVVYLMNKSIQFSVSRRNFYTGISRSRLHCTVITDQICMAKAVKFAG